MKTTRLTRSTIVLNAPETGPLALLRVCHAEGEDPVARLKKALASLPHQGHNAGASGGAGTAQWAQLRSLIQSTDWSAHQLHVEHVDHWDVLPIESSLDAG